MSKEDIPIQLPGQEHLKAFQAEMARRKEEEIREGKSVHLRDIDEDCLTIEDAVNLERVEQGEFDDPLAGYDAFNAIKFRIVNRELADADADVQQSRGEFYAYLGNLIGRRAMRRMSRSHA